MAFALQKLYTIPIKNINKSYNLIGDYDFVYNKSLLPQNVNLIYVSRTNQHKKYRYKIKNLFAKIKQFNRIHIKRDKKLYHLWVLFI